ncbi:E3 ubiquitin-protein ligase TRIM39-like [Sceloporus undulatus]|uniref:E3 ubiquitin-protein ligase TRIM39-like n=1 Tax=Sceloporus undulatus TaxID=8520 RepID=UPI001C4BB971|nr:E3 ubiquitin-protein ligase TRIM39-like [Sceloporus undulatus]
MDAHKSNNISTYQDNRFKKEYRFLARLLTRNQIDYKWERIEGVSFSYKQRRYRVNTIDKAKEIYEKISKDIEKERETKEEKKQYKNDIEERKEKKSPALAAAANVAAAAQPTSSPVRLFSYSAAEAPLPPAPTGGLMRRPASAGASGSARLTHSLVRAEEEAWGQCWEHGENLIWFCVQESALLCKVCKASGDQASHTVKSVEDAAPAMQDPEQAIQRHHRPPLNGNPCHTEITGKSDWKPTAVPQSQAEQTSVSSEAAGYKVRGRQPPARGPPPAHGGGRTGPRLAGATTPLPPPGLLQAPPRAHAAQASPSEAPSEAGKEPAELPTRDVKNVLSRSRNVTLVQTEAVSIEFKNIYNIPCINIIEILTKFKVDVTLDPATAHPSLVISEDRKSVKYGGRQSEQLTKENCTGRFDTYVLVLGSEKFTSGRHYWEVEVGDSTEWDLGVYREAVGRKEQVSIMSPMSGFWRLWLRNGDQYKALISRPILLPMNVKPMRVGVFLDYSEGKVSFYNVTEKTHIYTYVGTFYTPLRPFFSPSRPKKGDKAYPLNICPGPRNGNTRREADRPTQEPDFSNVL